MASNEYSLSPSTPKQYMHWIHCNICYQKYMKKEHRFYLLACHHVTCELCIVELEQTINGPRVYKCPVCQKITRACEINNTMPKHLKDLFHPQPFLDGLDVFQIMMFQEKHRRHFIEHMDRIEAEVARIRQENEKSRELARRLYQVYEQIKGERRYLENRIMRQERPELEDNRSSSSSSGYSSSTGSQA